MVEIATPSVSPEPMNRSAGALVLFLFIALLMPISLLGYHLILWFTEQTAITSGSQAQLEWAGLIGLAMQGLILTVVIAVLWWFSTDLRFKPVYAGWLVASLMAFPGLLLRLLGPNNDQLGYIIQIFMCVIPAVLAARARGRTSDQGNISLTFLFAAFGVGPFAVLGAFGSPTDVILSLLAGLSFGWFATMLMESTTENLFLDTLGIGAVLALLGS